MKHGPIALVDENTPSVFIMPHGFVYDKVMANVEEIKARGGPVIAIAAEGDDRIADLADDVIYMPRRRRSTCSPSRPSCRCNCWPTTSPCCAAATSTSRAIWRRA